MVTDAAAETVSSWAPPGVDDGSSTPEVRRVDADQAQQRLNEVVATFGGSPRPSQVRMVRAVADAIDARTHIAVSAPTGVGKSLGYAVPASLAAGRLPVLLSTATKALQQQLIEQDLPAIRGVDPDLNVALLKGRSEYVCVSKRRDTEQQDTLFEGQVDQDAWKSLLAWSYDTDTGDRAEAPEGVTNTEWRELSVSSNECPGKSKCAFGDVCFAEAARDRARTADIVVVNHHLVLHDALADRHVLPEHRVLVVDEAHEIVQIASSVLGCTINPRRCKDLASKVAEKVDAGRVNQLESAGNQLADLLGAVDEEAVVDMTAEPLAGILDNLAGAARAIYQALGSGDRSAASTDDGEDADAYNRLAKVAKGLADDAATIASAEDGQVVYVESGRSSRTLRMAPIEVADLLAELLFTERTVVATSATITVGGVLEPAAAQMGMDQHPWTQLQVPSPFDFASNALLYVPRDAPDPRKPGYDDMAYDTTLRLIEAAGGRTLLLFTSWSRLNATADWLAGRLPGGIEMLVQGEAPPRRLMQRYTDTESSILLGVASFWQGISAEGLSSVCVIIDKLPFARRGDPLTDARRQAAENAGRNGFNAVDLPHAAITLAQGAGRLIRTVDDFGCVAVLDSRLATARYRSTLLDSLPPAARTINLDVDVELPDDLEDRLDVLHTVPGGPPAVQWLRTRLAMAGR